MSSTGFLNDRRAWRETDLAMLKLPCVIFARTFISCPARRTSSGRSSAVDDLVAGECGTGRQRHKQDVGPEWLGLSGIVI